ncbi:isochorismate synthase DhbC [Paenibacillus oralis]|uniref:isochorismate synthase n=1 Tax=Paenibacillus oralis TaxID=2490856 RepID=A0A3P3U3N4_9BACL|nr:isochorismate synthase DhbC [Paenibacillus oralis]RRJ64967.1 isochorismate synthase DhbC [Paenibacillus oralis]
MPKYDDAALAASAVKLLEQYRTGTSFYFSSLERTLLTRGEWGRVSDQEGLDDCRRLPERAAELLAVARQKGHAMPLVVGAIPYAPARPAQLIVPDDVQWAGPLRFDAGMLKERPVASVWEVQPIPEPEAYMDGVNEALARLSEGELQKVVLSRTLLMTAPEAVDVQQILHNLACHNAHGYTFAADLAAEDGKAAEARRGPRTLIGASPELLITKKGLQVTANPLAGSAARSDDPNEDKRRATALLASDKDRHEHKVVIDAVVAALRPYCRELHVPAGPSLARTKTMWHLSTNITGELANPAVSSLELAMALHPTPAICGTPTELARAVIADIEPFDRAYYTGAVGWCDANGDGEWAVTIRCAEAEGRTLRLFAGAGIVAGSNAASELAETSAKFRTLLLAMGLDQEQCSRVKEG